MSIPKADQETFNMAKPYLLLLLTFLVWLRMPGWAVRACAVKAAEFIDSLEKTR